MLLNCDNLSIDTLATSHSTEDLSRAFAVLETVKSGKLSNGENIDENLAVIREAIKRQTESTIYMFCSTDELGNSLEEVADEDVIGFGVSKRVGDTLISMVPNLGRNISEKNISEFIEIHKITEVFTGNIEGEFLGLRSAYWDEHHGEEFQEKAEILNSDQIKILRALGVNVRVLNMLV